MIDRESDGSALDQLEAVEQDQEAQEKKDRYECDKCRHSIDSVQQRD